MPRRQFQRDLAGACLPGLFPRLVDVRGGSEDGLISFTYTTRSNEHTIDVQVTVPDTSEYPQNHDYFAFTDSEDVPEAVPLVLEASQPGFRGLPVRDFLNAISECLDEATIAEDCQWDYPQYGTDNDFEYDEIEWEDSDNEHLSLPADNSDLRKSIQADLRKARDAGFHVGYLGDLNGSVILSASHRIARMGISREAMEAWSVRPEQFLVLLIRYPHGYRPVADVVRSPKSLGVGPVQFHVGVCGSYKPSLSSAHRVFTSGTGMELVEPVLNDIFIGKSLHTLLNGRFMHILRSRLDYGFSWTGAELYVNDGQGKILNEKERRNRKYVESDKWDASSPAFLWGDHLADTQKQSAMSLLLIAMQFTLRRFVKCTEFCLNCYCKISAGFEALKPFVCSKGLCLYQYMALGMGPNLEWEISSQPYVVDLLISFAYASAVLGKLVDFPTGLQLKVLHPNRRLSTSKKPSSAVYTGNLTLSDKRGPCLCVDGAPKIREGDWIVILQYSRELHARVDDVSQWPHVYLSNLIDHSNQSPGARPLAGNVSFVAYDSDFDSLTNAEKHETLRELLNTLPGVLEMKTFVDKRDNGYLKPLKEWRERIHPAALYVLQWIVGSNRSVIMYDDDPQHQVSGMQTFLQFRFAQGAPDKEQRFVTSVTQTASRLNLKYPTLFAWHGSSFHNWHSIVREGLHYKYVAHGRSCGDGIYMSPSFHTSLGYSSGYSGGADLTTGDSWMWPKTRLGCTTAILLNEVVNAPLEFQSKNPNYVVQHLDWVQPRYLFVQCQTPLADLNRPKLEGLSHVYSQDPARVVVGPSGVPLNIPISAVNSHSSRKQVSPRPRRQRSKSKSNRGSRRGPGVAQDDSGGDDLNSVEALLEDQLLLLSEDEVSVGSEQLIEPRGKSIESATQDHHLAKTDFRPGSLDTSSIQLLGEPAYATTTATNILQKQLRVALRTQKKESPHELGWYIHSDLITNIYQWIMELHSFDKNLPLARDLKSAGLTSVVMEIRFPSQFPMSPPFIRVIRPRFLRFSEGGGGHITAGGAMCMELLTNSGWMPTSSIESVLLQVRMAITSDVPQSARLDPQRKNMDYRVGEAIAEYKRVCIAHKWAIPDDIDRIAWPSNSGV